MKAIIFSLLMVFGLNASAQITKVSLQASGLTCSMCSKAVKTALEKVDFVEAVQVDIKNQQYNLSFKKDAVIEIDALGKAVEDAGFSVASLTVTAQVPPVTLNKDEHVKIGNQFFHFLNGNNQQLDGNASFRIVDKNYVTAKEFKKYSGMTKMTCVKTGRMESCCSKDAEQAARIYHVII
jgi:copper chaperone CopZ